MVFVGPRRDSVPFEQSISSPLIILWIDRISANYFSHYILLVYNGKHCSELCNKERSICEHIGPAGNGLFYCNTHYNATLTRLGGNVLQFSSDKPEGTLFDLLVTDTLVEILSWLTDNETRKLLLVAKKFREPVKRALEKYPPKPHLSIDVSPSWWPFPQQYKYTFNFRPGSTFRSIGNKIDGYTLRLTPSKLSSQKTSWNLKYNADTTSIELNMVPFAHEDYELPLKVKLIAHRGQFSSVSSPIVIQLMPISVAQGTRHLSGGCFTEDALVFMADGRRLPASDVSVGDSILGGDMRAHIVMFVKATLPQVEEALVDLNGVTLTRGHPVMKNGEWFRPDEIKPSSKHRIDRRLINFMISGYDKTILLSATECDEPIRVSTLGCYCGHRLAALYPEKILEFGTAYELVSD